ncbi:MAG: hypothetical protein QE263_08270, partial [Vampirovibrionales bacterium]|nr:hypothetical protein [Vampirovibrionales bacterium]
KQKPLKDQLSDLQGAYDREHESYRGFQQICLLFGPDFKTEKSHLANLERLEAEIKKIEKKLVG